MVVQRKHGHRRVGGDGSKDDGRNGKKIFELGNG